MRHRAALHDGKHLGNAQAKNYHLRHTVQTRDFYNKNNKFPFLQY